MKPSFSSRFLQPYRRITSSGSFIPEIDGLRFIAISSVYLYHLAGDIQRHAPGDSPQFHATSWLFAVTQILNIGVPLFFVISGFILSMPFAMAHSHAGRTVSLGKYFLRRVTRLEPPYVLSLLVLFALKVATGRGLAAQLFPNLLASLVYVHNLVFGVPSAINIVAWSLEIEIQFYILAPLLTLIFVIRRPALRRLALLALLFIATGISTRFPPGHHDSILGYGQYFLAGFLLTEFYLSGGSRRRKDWRWDIVSAVGWSALIVLLVRGSGLAGWILPCLVLILYIAAFHGKLVNWFVTNLWITTIGGMCYTIYLLHNYTVAALGNLTEGLTLGQPFALRLAVQLLLMTPALLVISGLYFRLVERPCMRPHWPRELWGYVTGRVASRAASSSAVVAAAGPALAAQEEE
ncbi:MAG TPA: acyltransferase [Bryobacteraceae bacterium]|nr:acyltransferase [Bryobacteraceae bacterium]